MADASVLQMADASVLHGFGGSLANLILLNATTAVASGALADLGITDRFMKELTATLIPSSQRGAVGRTVTEMLLKQGKGSAICSYRSLAEAALCCCQLHGVRGDHSAGGWEAETRTYSCRGDTARSFY
jgi:hypothetical protein